jgi:lipoprotein NlpI
MKTICLFALVLSATLTASAQRPIDIIPSGPDPNTARIYGRVLLPSGRPINFNIRITLSNSQSQLSTLFSDKNGEFRFTGLSEGYYYVQATPPDNTFLPVTLRIQLIRGEEINLTLNLTLVRNETVRAAAARTVSASEASVPVRARREYERAQRFIKRGERQLAIERLKLALSIHPDYNAARNDLGVQYLKLKLLDEAAEQFNLLIEKDPRYFNPRLNLGLVLVEQKRFGEAIDQLRQAISIDSSRPAAHLWLGVALMEMNEVEEAERELLRSRLMGGKQYAVAQFYIAQLYLKTDRRGEALSQLEAYLEQSPLGEKAQEAKSLIEKLKK